MSWKIGLLELNMDCVDHSKSKYKGLDIKPLTSLSGLDRLPWWGAVRIFSANFHKIRAITLEDKQACAQLELLQLKDNEIDSVGDMKQLRNIVCLDMCGNKLTKLPASIAACTNLMELNLDRNRITGMPDLHLLQALQLIELAQNNLNEAPTMDKLPAADDEREIDVLGNPFNEHDKIGRYTLVDYQKRFFSDKSEDKHERRSKKNDGRRKKKKEIKEQACDTNLP